MAKKSDLPSRLCYLFVLLLLMSTQAAAQDSKASIRLWGQLNPFISGTAGSGQGAPDYDDAFSTGIGGGGEFAWRFCRWFSGVAGLGYEVYDGDTYQDVSFDDLEVFPIYAGGKFHLIPDAKRWDLYLRLDLGAAHLSSVDISYGNLKGRYWDSSWVFLFDVGGGAEYRWGAWGLSFEVRARYLDKPDDALGEPSKADAFWTLPIFLGANYHF